MTEDEMNNIVAALSGEPGDLLLFAADKNKVVWDTLGALRCHLADQMGLLDKNVFEFVWITEFPLLEWSDEQNRFTAMHHPFTMPMEEDLAIIDTDPGKVRAKAYDIVLMVTRLVVDLSESIRMIFRRRCLNALDLQGNRRMKDLVSC